MFYIYISCYGRSDLHKMFCHASSSTMVAYFRNVETTIVYFLSNNNKRPLSYGKPYYIVHFTLLHNRLVNFNQYLLISLLKIVLMNNYVKMPN